jgi:hypothetical protein
MAMSVQRAVVVLERTPRVVSGLLKGLGPEWVDRPYGEGTWPAREVVAHLIHAERTDWMVRVRHILQQADSSALPAFDRAGHKGLLEQTLDELLDEFARERVASVEALRALGLGEADMARGGVHPALGAVTLGNLVATWAVHDLNHVSQIAKAMAFQLRGEVGAWEAYLSILAAPNPR